MVNLVRSVVRILYGWVYWHIFCLQNNITYKSVVLVLCGENHLLDKYSVKYLELFVKRKTADKALIIWSEQATEEWLKQFILQLERTKIKYMPEKYVKFLYDFYSFDKFFDNIVFTYTSKPKENLLGRILEETGVDEKDAVCLALYHLRYVPE